MNSTSSPKLWAVEVVRFLDTLENGDRIFDAMMRAVEATKDAPQEEKTMERLMNKTLDIVLQEVVGDE